MAAVAWAAEKPKPGDKAIYVTGPGGLRLVVDNDDVETTGTWILTEAMVATLNVNWRTVYAFRCDNEDCDEYGKFCRRENTHVGERCHSCQQPLATEEVFSS